MGVDCHRRIMEQKSNQKKIKRTSLSIQDRLNIIERIKAGESTTNLALEYKVTRHAICKIKKSETEILKVKNVLTSCEGNLGKKKYKAVEDSLLDRKLYEWFKQKRSMGFVVNGPTLKKKALQFNKRLGGKENFAASDGWLTGFKSRHGIKQKKRHGEKLSSNSIKRKIKKEPDEKKIKRTSLSIQDRLNIIERVKAGESTTNLASEFKVTRQAICRIKKSETEILKVKNVLTSCEGNLGKKKYKAVEDSLLDRKLYEWFKQKRSMGFVVNGPTLKKKALQLNKRLGGKENFAASDGWLTGFKSRHGIQQKKKHGEKLSINSKGNEIFKYKMNNIREVTGIDLKYIYNCSESALYWKLMPTKTLEVEGRKEPKDRVSILFCVNASGTHKIPLFVIGKYASPQCFKNVNHLPVHYVHQVNAWMTCDLMKYWYTSVFLPAVKIEHNLEINPNIKVILLMDNAACHPPAQELNQICSSCSILYLPPNVTATLQPLNQGIIKKFKRLYRSKFLEHILAKDELQGEQDYLKSLNLIDCFNFCLLAWDSVLQSDIRNCWKNIIPLQNKDVSEIRSIEIQDFQNLLKNIPQFNDLSDDDVNNWLNADADDFGSQTLTDDNIVEETLSDNEVINAVEELDDEIEYKDLLSLPTESVLDDKCPTFIEALGGFKLLFRWLLKNGEDYNEYQPLLLQLHEKLLKKLVNDKVL